MNEQAQARRIMILSRWRAGEQQKAIARELGISPTRVRELIQRALREERRPDLQLLNDKMEFEKIQISTRARNLLRRHGLAENYIIDRERLARVLRSGEWRNMKNVGIVTAAEWESLL